MGAREQGARVVAALGEIVGEPHVLSSGPDRLAYGRDCWPRMIVRAREGDVRGHLPLAIAQPADEAEVVELVRFAEREQLPLIPYGAGSGVCGGAIPFDRAITVDLKRLRHHELDRDNLLLRAGPGAIGQHVETALLRAGYTLGHYPSSLYCSSIGGYLAARSAGQYSSRYGKIEDMVQSMRVVVGGGEILDTAETERGGGPGMLPLLVGSEGTLGIITDSLLRVAPAPEKRWYRGFLMPSVEAGCAAIRELVQLGLRPAVLRLYDELDTLLSGVRRRVKQHEALEDEAVGIAPAMFSRLMSRARGALGGVLDTEGLVGLVKRSSRGLMGRVLGQPLMIKQLERLVPDGCLLILGFEGPEAEVSAEAALALDIVGRMGEDVGERPGLHWFHNRFKVSYKMSPVMDTGAFVDTMEVATTWSNLMTLYSSVKRALSPLVVTLAHFSHAYPEGCSIYFTFAGFAPGLSSTLELYDETWKTALQTVAETGSSIAHHHGVGYSKAPYTPRDHPGGGQLFSALKTSLDPAGIFNPGKVWRLPHPDQREGKSGALPGEASS